MDPLEAFGALDLRVGRVIRAELNALDAELRNAIPRSSGLKRAHLEDLRFRIADALRMKD